MALMTSLCVTSRLLPVVFPSPTHIETRLRPFGVFPCRLHVSLDSALLSVVDPCLTPVDDLLSTKELSSAPDSPRNVTR